MKQSIKLLVALLLTGPGVFSSQAQVPGGVFSLKGAGGNALPDVLKNPDVVGLSVRQFWSDLEPIEGEFNFSYLDSQVQAAADNNKVVLLRINSQADKPAWVTQAVEEKGGTFFKFDDDGVPTTIPVFWDPTYLEKKKNMIRALGEHFANNPVVRIVCASFANAVSEDWNVPHEPEEVNDWIDAGYTTEKLVDAGQQIIDATMQAFPNQYVTLAIGGNGQLDDTVTEVAASTISMSRTKWPGRLIVQINSLSTFNPVAPGVDDTPWNLLWLSGPDDVGAQMLFNVSADDSCRVNGGVCDYDDGGAAVLATCVDAGDSYRVNYIEIYEVDVRNLKDVITYAREKLGPPPVPPSAPLATAATNIDPDGFTANWTAVSDATGYRLDVSSSLHLNDYQDVDVGNVTSYGVLGGGPDHYTYVVRAYNTAGSSPNSNTIALDIPQSPPIPPSAPVAAAATNINPGGFTANWTAVSDATGYRLDVSSGLHLNDYQNVDVGNVTRYGVLGGGPDHYTYVVRAYNTAGTSLNSNAISLDIPQSPQTPVAKSLNISTRGKVGVGNDVMIGGFIITGDAPKKVIVRAIGPSLEAVGVIGALGDPMLELHGAVDSLIVSGDNWKDDPDQALLIQASGLSPQDDLESAILATLSPGGYTAIVSGKNNTSGVALVEAYDLDQNGESQLANISTRCFVGTEADVAIGGFILGGVDNGPDVIIRALGPSLANLGVSNALSDPTLGLRDGNGILIAFDDNWQDKPAQAAQITAAGFAPQNALEPAIAITLSPGPYTAIIAGKNGTTGVALVEIYNLQ